MFVLAIQEDTHHHGLLQQGSYSYMSLVLDGETTPSDTFRERRHTQLMVDDWEISPMNTLRGAGGGRHELCLMGRLRVLTLSGGGYIADG